LILPRLLSVNSYHYRRGGADVVYFEHDRMFADAGWQTAVMSMHHPQNEYSAWSKYFVDELEWGFDYTPRQKVVMAAKVIYSWEARRKVGLLLDGFAADIAHLHCVYHHIGPAVLQELRRRGVPTVITAHELKLACPAYKMLNASGVCERCKGGNLTHVLRQRCIHGSIAASALVMVESWVHRTLGLYRNYLNAIVAPSRFYRRKLVEWGWPESLIHHIPNYVDCARFTPQSNPGRHFIYFGRLSSEKGLATLVRAAVAAGVNLKIVGTGPMEEALREIASGSRSIEFLGYLSGDTLWDEVRAARAVVLPSEWYENAPMSVLESYALAKPVVASLIGGIPELVEPDVTGWIFPPGDVEGLATLLQQVASIPDAQVKDVGESARRFVSSEFTRQRYFREMIALYSSLGVSQPATDAGLAA
jgi:glycosyltransferase involved in cell wall biosynthesis